MKVIQLVPLMSLMPCVSQPSSLLKECTHRCLSLPCSSDRYSSSLPVLGLRTALDWPNLAKLEMACRLALDRVLHLCSYVFVTLLL